MLFERSSAIFKLKIMNNLISKLDTDRFGFQIAKITDTVENPEMIIYELKKINVKMIIARVNLCNMKLINQLERLGFDYKDAQITFSYDLKKELPQPRKNEFSLTRLKSEHLACLIEMTKDSFTGYGHYFADERLDKMKCLEIYMDWIKRCCDNKSVADEVIVAEKNNIAIGYLAIKKYDSGSQQFYAGVIGAVAPEFRKYGVFQAINIESLYYAKKMGAQRFENNVLVTNFPVMKTYTSMAYQIIRSEITMHYWFE